VVAKPLRDGRVLIGVDEPGDCTGASPEPALRWSSDGALAVKRTPFESGCHVSIDWRADRTGTAPPKRADPHNQPCRSRADGQPRFVDGTEPAITGRIDRFTIEAQVRRMEHQLRFCYQRHNAGESPGPEARLLIDFVIDAQGRTGDVALRESTLEQEDVVECLLERVRRWTFPTPPGGGPVRVEGFHVPVARSNFNGPAS
jgi:hypothetical protein